MTSWRTRHSYLARKFGHFFLLLRTFRAERGLAIGGALSLAGLALMQFVRVERQNARIDEGRYDRGTDAYARPNRRHYTSRLPGLPYRTEQTVWPWYSNGTPMLWLMVADVNAGREHMNFSKWGDIA